MMESINIYIINIIGPTILKKSYSMNNKVKSSLNEVARLRKFKRGVGWFLMIHPFYLYRLLTPKPEPLSHRFQSFSV